MPRRLFMNYRRFSKDYCLRLQDSQTKMLIWRWNKQDPPKNRRLITSYHGIILQKT